MLKFRLHHHFFDSHGKIEEPTTRVVAFHIFFHFPTQIKVQISCDCSPPSEFTLPHLKFLTVWLGREYGSVKILAARNVVT